MKRLKPPSPEVILIVGIILILIAPGIVSLSSGIGSFNDSTGVIGDTIGGITAPITGLIGSYLVYMALKAQIEANKIITDQFKEQKKDEETNKLISIVTDQLKMLREDIKNFQFVEYGFVGSDTTYHYSSDAIKKALDSYPIRHITNLATVQTRKTQISEIKYFLTNIHYLIKQIKKASIASDDKIYLLRLLAELHHTKFFNAVIEHKDMRRSEQATCNICKVKHGIPDIIFEINDSVSDELISYDLN